MMNDRGRSSPFPDAESRRLLDDERRERNWKRWGPYLAERQWGTVREDYSDDENPWTYLTHDHSRSRAYRWGEDGLFGFTDRECRLCFAIALWNGKDPILKERLFGLTNPEGNHGEDVKELYYYLDATPTSSYLKALYKYPQCEFPYAALVDENRRRRNHDPEFEIEDTHVFDDAGYFDVFVEYAKATPDDILIRVTCANRGSATATLHLLPTLWQRNTWAWGRGGEGYWPKGQIARVSDTVLVAEHPSLGRYRLACDIVSGASPQLMFTENETNTEKLFHSPNTTPYVKDAFHRCIIDAKRDAVNPAGIGTKAAAWYELTLPAGHEVAVRLRLSTEAEAPKDPFGTKFDQTFELRKQEADAFYAARRDAPLSEEERKIVRQADAGLLWSRQFYNFVVDQWLDGDPAQPPPPASRASGPNRKWRHLHARDILSVPDKWEYPWFAAWDLAFHCVALARIDPAFAKRQVLLLCREWYMQPNGQLPAYEFGFGDVNPPVHAWAAWRVYQLAADRGFGKDRLFLESAFQKCIINFTWWVNREDIDGDNLFSGGFLGLDNISLFDRSKPLPHGGRLEQADATAWMAFYCSTMLAMALELAREDPAYADIASKFFEHFMEIAEAMNGLGGTGLWHDGDGFYYDQARMDGRIEPLRIRSMVGLVPLFAAESLESEHLERLPLFASRLKWFLDNKPALASDIACLHPDAKCEHRLLAIPTRERLERVLTHLLDEREFLSPYGVRSLSKVHLDHPVVVEFGGKHREVHYAPGESDIALFGANSNWRGPVWFPVNYLLIEALKRHHHFYRDTLRVECPTRSGNKMTLLEVAEELERRLTRIFLPDSTGRRPCHGRSERYVKDPHFKDLILFYEYFHGEDGRGLGASHQTGWTALAANLLERTALVRQTIQA